MNCTHCTQTTKVRLLMV